VAASRSTIDRIEITRGNPSSLYGSSAIGGVVQIFTRSAQRPGASISVEAGSGRSLNGAAAPADAGGRIGARSAYRGSEQISPSMRRGSSPVRRRRSNADFDIIVTRPRAGLVCTAGGTLVRPMHG
jgi:outer membrane receptor protein involved in Fe transport